jgi:hypothetical protein
VTMSLPLWLGASVPGWVDMSVHGTPGTSVYGAPDAPVHGAPEASVHGTPEASVHTAKYKWPVFPPSFAPSVPTSILLLLLHYSTPFHSMLSPCDNSSNSFSNDVDASSPPSNNAVSHKVAPSPQDQRKQPLVNRCLSTINPDIPQPSGALSNPMVQTTTSRFVYSTSHTANTNSIPQ